VIAGILLAAGAGRRFGGSAKLLAPLADGTPVVQAAARSLLDAGLGRCLAVVRPGDEEVAAVLRATGLAVVPCAASERGMGASLAAGVAATRQADGWLIALGDMPWIAPATLAAVADALRHGAPLAAPYHQGQGGHPVGFSAALGGELRALDGAEGARRVVAANRARRVRVPVADPGILRDVDVPEDLACDPPS